MDNVTKASDETSQHRTEDVDQVKHQGQNKARGADRAANLIGDQQVEVTEEDVKSTRTTTPKPLNGHTRITHIHIHTHTHIHIHTHTQLTNPS